MGVQYDTQRRKFVVRWQEAGRKRCRRFATEEEAAAFDATLERNRGRPPEPDAAPIPSAGGRPPKKHGEGVYAYETRVGLRWRVIFRQSDGTLSSRRGFTSRTAAVKARRRLQESVDRGEVKVSRERFADFWTQFVVERRPYMTSGSHLDLSTHGRKRLVPFFASDRLARIDEERVREWLATMVELVEAGELSPKTVNYARTCLSVMQPRQTGRARIIVRLVPYTLPPRFRAWATTADASAAVLAAVEDLALQRGFASSWTVPDPAGVAVTLPLATGARHRDAAGGGLEASARAVIDAGAGRTRLE